jgi:hypothetical protein
MALVNPNIAMSFRAPEMPQQNALADYAAIQQIQGGQRQAEVSQMQLESMRRDQAALSKMQAAITAKGGPADLNTAADEMIKSGIPEYLKQGLVIKQTLDKQSRFASLLGPTGGAAPAAAPASEAYPGYNESIGMAAPSVNAMAPAAATAAPSVNAMSDMRNKINQAYAIGTPEALAWAKAREDEFKPMTVSPGASVFQGGQSVFTAPATPAAPPSMVAEYNFAKTLNGGNFKGSYQDFVTARAAAGRAPAAPSAPSITQIVDPTNPNQMITIDARRYQSGGAGSPGVIGVAGKEPGAALRQNKTEAGKTQLADDLDNLRASFQTLDTMRAIPSTQRNALSNVASGLAATGIGQKTGQLFGTEAQVERDVINSARTRLVNSIKNATGMSAQQLNSNVELQTMLKSISDPGQSVQAALRIIDDIDNAYVKGDGKLPKRGAPAAANVVVTPDGQSHTFPTPAAAAEFKKAAGL